VIWVLRLADFSSSEVTTKIVLYSTKILKAIILEFHNGDPKFNNFNASDAYIFGELLIICSRWLMPVGANVVLVLRRRKLERGYYSDFINISSFMLY